MSDEIYQVLATEGPLVCDGAMGTLLQELGLQDGGAPELWNVEKPEVIEQILENYAQAGARFLTTNTFGGTRSRLKLHDLADRVIELNSAGAQVARRVADRHAGVYVLGDIGPIGELMEPMGELTIESAKEIFAEQILGLVNGGVDAILIETMSDLAEAQAAVLASKQTAPDLPLIVTMSFDTNLRTMMGTKPELAITVLSNLGVRIIGANCGRGTDEMRIIAKELVAARTPGTFLIVQSNAGLPQLHGEVFEYDGTPDEMALFAVEMEELGIDIIGSCCGSTSQHTKAITDALRLRTPQA
ncbi:MAG TPA: homocysteine S-methyltransferase family protein [Candidatus Nanopelagicaceae bacterium]|nr:homocysteine S-methyltransferase family protein [Candidatus Nanopelagicaceae bacterium]